MQRFCLTGQLGCFQKTKTSVFANQPTVHSGGAALVGLLSTGSMTHDMWHVTCDTWHMTDWGVWTISQNISSLPLKVWLLLVDLSLSWMKINQNQPRQTKINQQQSRLTNYTQSPTTWIKIWNQPRLTKMNQDQPRPRRSTKINNDKQRSIRIIHDIPISINACLFLGKVLLG